MNPPYASTGHILPDFFYSDAEMSTPRAEWTQKETKRNKRRALARMKLCGLRNIFRIRYCDSVQNGTINALKAMAERGATFNPFTALWMEETGDIVYAFTTTEDQVLFRLMLAEFGVELS